MLKNDLRCYQKVYEPLAGQYIKEMFDIHKDYRGTWLTAEFTSGDIHLVLIPGLCVWDERKAKIFTGYPIREALAGYRISSDMNKNHYFVMEIGDWRVWFLFEKVDKGVVEK